MKADHSVRLLAAMLLSTTLLPSHASALEAYEVVGVAAGDVLTVRQEPEDGGKPADWKEVARIPAEAKNVLGTGRSKTVGTQRWMEVTHGGATGWVNAKHLQGIYGEAPSDVVFQCGGTEPFWSVGLTRPQATYSTPEVEGEDKLAVEAVIVATGRMGAPVLYRLRSQKGAGFQAVVSPREWCSDGMSDYDYAFEVLFSDDSSLKQGCCTIKR